MTTTTRTTVTRCAAASILMIIFFVGQSAAQDHQNMPGMRKPMPTPSPKASPTPKPSPTPAPMQMPGMQVPTSTPSPQATPRSLEGMQNRRESKPQPSTGEAANPQAPPQTSSPAAAQDTKTLPNLSDRSGWPEPVSDRATYSFALFDLLEYGRAGGVNALRWDFLGWRGGDRNRFWFKSEGELNFESPLGGQADLQLLYGRLISPFFDLQLGVRFEQHYERKSKPSRVFAVVALQGLAPGRFEVEPSLFLSNKGKVSGRFTASLDLFQTQRLILQPRFETEFAAQRDEAFGVERGLGDAEIGVRLRYEVRREFAPYLGVSYRRSFGATRERVLREGGAPNEVQFAVGVRTWF